MKFETKFTVRVYDDDLTKKIDKLFKQFDGHFPTMNKFLVECLERGIEVIGKRFFDDEGSFKSTDDIFKETKRQTKYLSDLMDICERQFKQIYIDAQIDKKLLLSSYEMLLGLSEKQPYSRAHADSGALDDMVPDRFYDIIEQLAKEFKLK